MDLNTFSFDKNGSYHPVNIDEGGAIQKYKYASQARDYARSVKI